MNELDRALERLLDRDLEYEGFGFDGLANHAPMAAEALLAVGLEDAIGPYLEATYPTLRPLPEGARIADRQAALGDPSRRADWVATWEAALLADAPWEAVLRRALPPLLPGLFAAALHGWIRVGHAVRHLERGDGPVRRRELARGLALWSSRYQTLPGEVGSRPSASASRVLDGTLRARGEGGLIVERVRGVDEHPGFRARVESWDPHADGPFALDAFVRHAVELGAARVLEVPSARIAYCHAVTGPSALRLLAPYLTPEDQLRAAGELLKVTLALDAVHAPADLGPPSAPATGAPAPDALRAAMARSTDDHALKLGEAALREASPLARRAAGVWLGISA